MYVVTASGQKLPVDDSSIKWGDYLPFQQSVGLYTEDTVLKEVWVLQLFKVDDPFDSKKFELDFIKDLKYEHKPTKEDILYAMSQNGLSRFDIATYYKAYELDVE